MRIFLIFLFLAISCSQMTSSNLNNDEFSKIIVVMKSKSPIDLYQYFGKPNEILNDAEDSNIQILKYNNPLIDAYLNKEKNKLSHMTLFYWRDFDNYTALKERFKNYEWVEAKLPDNPKSDVLTDLYIVKIPAINMEFQYDNYAPKRKVMWIFFE